MRKQAWAAASPLINARRCTFTDAVDYAVNARNLAVVGYGGEDDPQLRAAINVLDALAFDGAQFSRQGLDWSTQSLNAIFLVGPATGHRFHPESKLRAERFIRDALADGGKRRKASAA